MASCASCHSRREELTGQFHPGEKFDDHYRLTLPDLSDTYFPDGQVRDENFEYASFLGSKMGHAGVTCLDCHQAHSAKLKLPVENNAMCMSCHTPPGTNGATPIPDPMAHSHHGSNSKGNRCVECHMPETTYMARDPRRDHGFTIPDPLLTKELGIPNACNRCHTDQTVDWAIEWSEKWYGQKLARPSRERARLVARARAGDSSIDQEVINFYQTEPNAAWRATLISLLEGRENRPAVADFLASNLSEESPLVRAAAVRSLGAERKDLLETSLADPSRNVRVTAAWTLLMEGKTIAAEKRKEIRDYLSNLSETPMGAFQQARLAAVENRLPEMDRWVQRASERDPSPGLFQQAAILMVQVERPAEARKLFERSLKDDPTNSQTTYQLALLEAEMGNSTSAMTLLQKSVELDPQFGRAWYNLGLAKAAAGKLNESVRALTAASELLPQDPDPPYALATVFARLNDPQNAAAAATKTLAIDPNHEPTKNLLRGMSRQGRPNQ